MKKTLALLMCTMLMIASLVGCAPATTPAPAAQQTAAPAAEAPVAEKPAEAPAASERSFAFVTSSLNNPFFTTISDTFQTICKENGQSYVVLDPQYDQAKQISMMEDVITQNVSAIFVIAVDSDGIKPALETAKAKGVPVIAIDNPVTDVDLVTATVASDNYNAGLLCGQTMAKDFPEGADIAVIDFPIAVACVDRVNGFFDGLGALKDKFNVVAQQDGSASLEKSMPIAENMIQAHPGIKAFFCINDPTALGTIAALKAANKLEGMKIYAVDGSPDAKKALLDDTLSLTVAQSPVNLAKTSYEIANKVLDGGSISDKNVKVETFSIDKSNVDQYGTDGWQ